MKLRPIGEHSLSRRGRRRRIATGTAIAAGLTGLASTTARSVPEDATPLAPDTLVMATSFSDYGLGAYAVSAISAGVAFRTRPGPLPLLLGAAALGLGGWHASWLLPRFVRTRRRTADPGSQRFTLLSQNVELGQGDPASLLRAAAGAEVVVLLEVTAPQVRALNRLGWRDRFPHATADTLPDEGAAGTAVFSRFPLSGADPVEGLMHQTWLVGIDVPDLGDIRLVAVRPTRPYRGGHEWRGEQDRLRGLIPAGARVIVAGDFNAVDSHRPIRLLRRLGYRSSTELAAAGWRPTFPANAKVPAMIEIDHVLLGPGLTATSSGTVRVAGTDHLGVLTEISRTDGT